MDVLLKDFTPKCQLVTEIHTIGRARFPVTDFHTHFGRSFLGEDFMNRYDTAEEVCRLRELGIHRVVNLDGFWGETLDRVLKKAAGFEDFFLTFGGVDVTDIDAPDFECRTSKSIRKMKRLGIRGLKFFKELGLKYRDSHGHYILPDDPRLQVIWHTAAEERLPILIHIGDPVAFFEPIDCFNERIEELAVHPDWSFYGSGHPSFCRLMEAQERMLENNPDTTFVIAHMGSYCENLAQVGRWLDRYPNMNIDLAARMAELGRQPYTSREFLTRYRDRVVFGTDYGAHFTSWPIDFRFLETYDEYFRYDNAPKPLQGRWNICGLGLDDETLQKIYAGNARRILGEE